MSAWVALILLDDADADREFAVTTQAVLGPYPTKEIAERLGAEVIDALEAMEPEREDDYGDPARAWGLDVFELGARFTISRDEEGLPTIEVTQ